VHLGMWFVAFRLFPEPPGPSPVVE
jgi:hypothetical protein